MVFLKCIFSHRIYIYIYILWSVVKWLRLGALIAGAQGLVGELKSSKLHDMAKK